MVVEQLDSVCLDFEYLQHSEEKNVLECVILRFDVKRISSISNVSDSSFLIEA